MMRFPKFKSPIGFILLGIGGTLLVQKCFQPSRLAYVRSPDGDRVFIVERYRETWLGPTCRSFQIWWCDRDGDLVGLTDGAIYIQHEYISGGIDMSNMKISWRGRTAVASFGGIRLERAFMENERDDGWHMIGLAPATTQSAGYTSNR